MLSATITILAFYSSGKLKHFLLCIGSSLLLCSLYNSVQYKYVILNWIDPLSLKLHVLCWHPFGVIFKQSIWNMRQNKAHFLLSVAFFCKQIHQNNKSPFGDLNRHLIFALRNIEF